MFTFHPQPYPTSVYLPLLSASSTAITHTTHSKNRGRGSTFNSKTHGYGYGTVAVHEKGKEPEKVDGHPYEVGLGVDGVYVPNEPLLSYHDDIEPQYDDTKKGEGDTTLHIPHCALPAASTPRGAGAERVPTANIRQRHEHENNDSDWAVRAMGSGR